ncbi:hypothetical protein FIA58_013395 [Flavobacterium jejuense]|uniref:Peptidase C39 domain-containing protein n=1 Tax=Flavobacterium jejuense TaxID=1544455 RepID=A0ABX0IV21_9FLAO|nr:cysteine peptidase family C39 domain-containing protein [Flavobacterium jejuense]NHN26674.1 hypothetical protein [Flavobacterium jejuense]
MEKLVFRYLQKVKYDFKVNEYKETYSSHPNYPSLLAITESLTTVGIDNIAVNVPFVHIDELPIFFLTELSINTNSELYLLVNKEENFVIENEKQEIEILNKEDLEKYWKGTVLIIKENENLN